jgi:alpha-beta hydrolase superfamily lysophospholipase
VGCGGTWQATFEPHGAGKDQYWVVHAKGKPKAVVVLLHGFGQDSGEQLQPWQVHLAERGYDVTSAPQRSAQSGIAPTS